MYECVCGGDKQRNRVFSLNFFFYHVVSFLGEGGKSLFLVVWIVGDS